MSWFDSIKTPKIKEKPSEKVVRVPEGLWVKCPECSFICTVSELREHMFVCLKCNFHHRINSSEYYEIMFDNNDFIELFDNIRSKDFLEFTDLKPYKKRLEEI